MFETLIGFDFCIISNIYTWGTTPKEKKKESEGSRFRVGISNRGKYSLSITITLNEKKQSQSRRAEPTNNKLSNNTVEKEKSKRNQTCKLNSPIVNNATSETMKSIRQMMSGERSG